MELAQALSGAAATNAVLLNSTSWLAASGNDRVALVTICRMTLPLLSARDTGNEHSHERSRASLISSGALRSRAARALVHKRGGRGGRRGGAPPLKRETLGGRVEDVVKGKHALAVLIPASPKPCGVRCVRCMRCVWYVRVRLLVQGHCGVEKGEERKPTSGGTGEWRVASGEGRYQGWQRRGLRPPPGRWLQRP